MTDLSALIERVESGAGYDNELNKDVALALGWTIETGLAQGLRWRKPDGTLTAGNPEYEDAINATGSLDAVLSLIEAKLPGWAIAEMKAGIRHEDGPYCHVRLWCPVNSALGYKYPSNAPTPARAALAAALRAIQESRT